MEELIKLHSEEKQYCVYAHYYEDQLFYIGSGSIYRNSRGLRGRSFNLKNRSMEWFFFCNGEIDKVTVEILFVTNDVKLSLDKEEEITRYYMKLETPLVNVKIGNKMSKEQKKNASGENNPWYGMKHTKESRKKISEAQRGEKNNNWGKKGKDAPFYGKKHSEETKIKMSETREGENHPMYGKTHSKESKKKMSLALSGENNPNYGKKHSTESRKKMSESKNGEKNPRAKKVLITNNENGEQISSPTIKGVYEFIVEKGFDKTKCTLQRCLKKGPFTFKNYTFELTK